MLDAETRRKIDSLRDILVGIIPNPQTQIDHITTGLIYKFIYDMDQESISMGGKASFFTDDYDRYSWDKLFDSKLGGSELIKLYRDAVESFYLNPNAPELFRDLFKNASSPTTNAPVLKMFLKEINEFEYSNSESLGNAFEYLLSFMGSQGDAGQFRTPRHIIDFIVEIIDPQKHEKILDPACGTAGFLISAYKYICKNKLSATEIKKVTENIHGYDITPEMVRLSQVNMYLHNFVNPNIYEYDTLTSEERWNDYYDVILANPPFMTPKGGIKPHNRFGVESKKAEVLFTDYILEHLKPEGRSAIIVPEGIIFQISNAYRELRKQLIQNGLVGLVSLPSGIFKPYSGVKTSILIIDKKLNKKIDSIFITKIENDGFDLGDNRRPIDKNDLPVILKSIKDYFLTLKQSDNMFLVKKENILSSNSVTLNLFQEENSSEESDYKFFKFGDICNLYQPKTITQDDLIENGKYYVYGANGIIGKYNDFNHEKPEVVITCRGATCGSINFTLPFSWITGNAMVASPKDESFLSKSFLFFLLKNVDFSKIITGAAQPQITRTNLEVLELPIPSLDTQNKITNLLEGYQKIIDGCNMVIDNFKPDFIIDSSWESYELMDVCERITDGSHTSPLSSDIGKPYVTVKDLNNGNIDLLNCKKINDIDFSNLVRNGCKPNINDILFSKDGTVGKTAIVKEDDNFVVLSSLAIITPNTSKILPEFLYEYMSTNRFIDEAIKNKTGVAIKRIVLKTLKSIHIPLPDIKTQSEIVKEIKLLRSVIEENRKLQIFYSAKIKEIINNLWK